MILASRLHGWLDSITLATEISSLQPFMVVTICHFSANFRTELLFQCHFSYV